MTKTKLTRLLLVAILLVLPLTGLAFPIKAAVLTDIVVTPAALTVSTATNVTIAFTPVTTITKNNS